MWKDNVIFQNSLAVLQLVSYLVSILGIIGIYITVVQFKKKAENDNKQDEERKVMNSIKVMEIFAKELIPNMQKVKESLGGIHDEMIKNAIDTLEEKIHKNKKVYGELSENDARDFARKAFYDDNDQARQVRKSIEAEAKGQAGFINVFNQLEQISTYMNYGLIVEEMVYPGMHKVFIQFVQENEYMFNNMRSDEAPYKELTKLYNSWKNKQEYDSVDKERKLLENKLEKLRVISNVSREDDNHV
jgi:hypothetical protein